MTPNLLYVVLLVALALTGGIAFYYYRRFRLLHQSHLFLQQQVHQLQAGQQQSVLDKQNLSAEIGRLQDQNATKNKFFSILAHDLKSPLSTIVGFLEILNDHVDEFTPEEIRNFASSMNKSVKNLLALLDNLLQWSRSQTGTIEYLPSEFHLEEIINENVSLISGHAQSKRITIHTEVPEMLKVRADRNMLHTIIRNLLSNAVKFTRKGGAVSVFAAWKNGCIAITVKDNGIGMSAEKLQLLFKMDSYKSSFGTAEEKGNGLGLLLCQEFAEKNKGTLSVESQPGEGTSFTITLPRE